MRITFSWDDGAIEDIKLMELHEKYQIPGMFFIPTKNSEGRSVITPSQIKTYASDLISFGGHTKNHVFLTDIPIENVECEIIDNKNYLEDILGKEVCHFCLPGGKYNEDILSIGYRYYKTIRTADTYNFNRKESLVIPTFHFYPRSFKSRVGNCIRQKSRKELVYACSHPFLNNFEIIENLLDIDNNDSKDIIIWGHSWEIEKLELWGKLEELFTNIKEHHISSCVTYNDLVASK